MPDKRLILFQGLPGCGLTTSVQRYAKAQDTRVYTRIIVGNLLEPYNKSPRVTHRTYNVHYYRTIAGMVRWHTVKAMCDATPLILVDFYNYDAQFVNDIIEFARIDKYHVTIKQPDSDIWNDAVRPVLLNKAEAIENGRFDQVVNILFKNQVSTRYDRAFIKTMMNRIVLR